MILCIVGPTGVGKTKLSIELAKRYNGEIINADSTQVYRNLNIATAKVTKEEMQGIKHHLIDIKNVDDNYTVYDYQKDCRAKIKEITEKGKNVIIVGGTGLYIKAALYDYRFEDEDNINNYDNLTNEELYNLCIEKNKDMNIHRNNRKRLIRFLNKQSINNIEPKLLYKDTIFIGLTTNRSILYDRINKRVDIMISNGLIDEARKLYNLGIRSKAIMTPIGYKELFDYFDGFKKLNEQIELIKQRSRRYAKRQYTWFNNQMEINWFDVEFSNFNNTINEVCKYIQKNN